MILNYDPQEFYRAHLSRDRRFDGKFFVAVKTTKIYCRPICPARKAKLENLEFFIHKAQAEEAGYRPCLRCRPETAPGSPAWLGTSTTVQRAIRIMDAEALHDISMASLAEKLGIGERWLRDLFQKQVGVNPQAILIAKKLDIASSLLESSALSVTEIAFSSGFQSIRRFNSAFKARFQKNPSAFRRKSVAKGSLHFQLSYRPPYASHELLNFFKYRAISQIEHVESNSYQRLIALNDIRGWFKATLIEENKINLEFKLNKSANILEFVARVKNIFDLDADPMAIETGLHGDEQLHLFLKQHSGLRIPGCWDGFELAVRAIVGQKISVKGARTLLERLIERCGELQTLDESLSLTHFFPSAEDILAADLSQVGLTQAKITTLKALAHEVVHHNIILDGTADYEKTCQNLLAIKGIGPWTVQYIAMRALRDPNAFPETDLELQKKITRLHLTPEKWAPWRAYAAILLWNLK